jgi:hypothetical protein
MKYFFLYTAVNEEDPFSDKYYIKGKSIQQVLNQIEHFSNGWINTSQFGLCTQNIKYGYLREVNIKNFPELSSKDFAQICESKCISF